MAAAAWAVLVALVVVAAAAVRPHFRERLAFPPFEDSPGHWTPVPGDPDRNILRRSQPYPDMYADIGGGRGALADFYFRFDPAYSTSFQHDACYRNPACAGFAL